MIKVEDLESNSSPPTKKSRLDYEAIIMGEVLSDIHINVAQSILKVQFNKLNGLESILYQTQKIGQKIISNKIQIVHYKDR